MNRPLASLVGLQIGQRRSSSRRSGRAARPLRFESLESRVVFSAPGDAQVAKAGGGSTGTVCTGYPLEDSVQSQLQTLAAAHSTLAQVSSIGTLASGRDIWVMHISDNVTVDEADEPAVAYTATMHGNEPDGVTLSLGLIGELLGSYGTNARVTELVNSTDIWIVPLLNPDGLAGCTRANAGGFDLNRSYPDLSADAAQFTNQLSTPLTPSQLAAIAAKTPETAALMQWSAQHNFVLAADFHENGGQAVVNYPYDKMQGVASGAYAKSPDDDLFKYISKVYSSHDRQMWDAASKKGLYGTPYLDGSGRRVAALTVNSTFPQGITNGSDWFTAGGTLQDWHYRYLGTNAVTVEVRDKGEFATSDELWSANRDSMLAYLQAAHVGTTGRVVDASNNLPIAASIAVTGSGTDGTGAPITVNQHFVFSDPDDGSFFRMLRPGIYPNLTVTVSSPGYVTRSFSRTVEIANPNNSTVPPSALPVLPGLVNLGPFSLARTAAAFAPMAFAASNDAAVSGGAIANEGPSTANRSVSATSLPTTLVVTSGATPIGVLKQSAGAGRSIDTSASGSLSFAQAADLVWAESLGSSFIDT